MHDGLRYSLFALAVLEADTRVPRARILVLREEPSDQAGRSQRRIGTDLICERGIIISIATAQLCVELLYDGAECHHAPMICEYVIRSCH